MQRNQRSKSLGRLLVAGSAAMMLLGGSKAHAAKMIGYWESYGNIPLANVSSNYDIINLAFATPSGPAGAFVTWGQSAESDAQFRADIQTLHSRGKKVVLSIGGGGSPALNLQNAGDVSNFVTDVENLCSSYGFDGIDLDDESGVFNLQGGDNDFTNPTTPTIKNYISGAQQIANHFGSGFIVSMANQTNDIDAYGSYGFNPNNGVTWGSYLPIVYAMRNYNQIVETQCYNTGSVYARNGQLVNEGSPDLDVGLSELLLLGYHMGNGQNFPAIPQTEVAFGVPATSNAADGASWMSPQGVLNAAKYIGSGTPAGGSYGLEGGPYPNFAGVMTWDINYDQNQNQGLASTLHPYLASIGGGTTVPEAPYAGVIALPGTLQIENYDVGGEGVSYHDSDTVNSGGAYRSDGVDIEACTDTGGGYNIGYTNAGEWMKYTVNVATAGTYTLAFRVADGTTANGTFHLSNASGATLCSGTVTPTGGWQTWANVTATVTLPAGQQILTFNEDSSNFNINSIGFTYNPPAEGPYNGTPASIPGTVQAENFDVGGEGVAYHDAEAANQGGQYRTADGVDIETCTDTGGGFDVGWNSVGEWQKYTVNVATAGTYTVTFRVANGATAAGSFHLQNSAGTNLSGTVTVPVTGAWTTWTNVTANVTLPAGLQILQLSDDGSNYNINYMAFAAAATAPAAPTGLTGNAGNTLVNLSWNASSGATSYNVYSAGVLKKSGITTTSTQITGLTNGTSYPFTVAAVNAAGTSGMSNQISLTPVGGATEAPYLGTPWAIPGTVQSENYDTGGEGLAYHDTEAANQGGQYRTADGVDIEACTDTGGGYNIGYTNAGEYMKYTVNVATAGQYTVTFRVANGATAAGTFHLSNASGTNLTGTVTVPVTGGWQTWTNVTATVTLPAGQQILTLNEDSANFNINYMSFASSGGIQGIDLIVTSVSWSPTSPTAGSHVVWSCVVKNQGNTATPVGTIIGVQFAVDGATTPINWSDNDTTSLAPGASVTLTATGGTNGVNYWPATSGSHTILAWVDDVNRIAEANENNNKLTATVSVP